MGDRVLIIAPHADDEVLGVGGTMARLAAEGATLQVVVVTRGMLPLFDDDGVRRVRMEALEAHRILGVEQTRFLDFPAANLDTVPQYQINLRLTEICAEIRPNIVFIPFNGDIHLDHQLVFQSALVAVRPRGQFEKIKILCYETLSETNWNAAHITPSFIPNTYINIEHYLDVKLNAMSQYSSQIKPFPHERSLETLRALAALRGSTVGCRAAEAFLLIRDSF